MSSSEKLKDRSWVFNQQPHESDVAYARSVNDPLDYAYPTGRGREHLITLDDEGLRSAMVRDDTREIIEFSTDLACLEFMEEAGDVQAHTEVAIQALQEKLGDTSLAPDEYLNLVSKLLDMASLQAFNSYHSNAGQLKAPERKKALTILEASSMTVVLQGARILGEMQDTLSTLRTGERTKKRTELVGRMFELLYATYRRLEIYGQEEYEQLLLLGTSEFQDRAAMCFKPRHNFDFMEISATGEVARLSHCKTNLSREEYDPSIHPVYGKNIDDFFEDPSKYVRAMRLAVGNPEDPRYEPAMKKALETLSSLFNRDHQQIGSQATQAVVQI